MKTTPEMQRTLLKNMKRKGVLPKPQYNIADLQMVVVIDDANGPFSAVLMTNDQLDAISATFREWREAGNENYSGIWTATRSKENPEWKIDDWSHVSF